MQRKATQKRRLVLEVHLTIVQKLFSHSDSIWEVDSIRASLLEGTREKPLALIFFFFLFGHESLGQL